MFLSAPNTLLLNVPECFRASFISSYQLYIGTLEEDLAQGPVLIQGMGLIEEAKKEVEVKIVPRAVLETEVALKVQLSLLIRGNIE